MWLRRVHRIVGLVFGPLLAITAGAGGLLAAADAGGFGGYPFRRFLKHLHNYESLSLWLGVVVGVVLLLLAATGWALWWQTFLRKRRARQNVSR